MIDVVPVSSTNFGAQLQQSCCPMKIFKPSTLVSLGIAIAAALVTQPMRATAINTLVITENSSTSLTATLTTSSGTTFLTVTPNGADNWFVALAGFAGNQTWTEPGAASVVNSVQGQPFSNRISIASDLGSVSSGLADGTMDTTSFTLNGSPLSVTFFDKGDVATAPDPGSTLGLLSLSVVALLGATRLRFLQLAA
jgi:hypothetical protein